MLLKISVHGQGINRDSYKKNNILVMRIQIHTIEGYQDPDPSLGIKIMQKSLTSWAWNFLCIVQAIKRYRTGRMFTYFCMQNGKLFYLLIDNF